MHNIYFIHNFFFQKVKIQELNSGDKDFRAKLFEHIFAVLLLVIIATLTASAVVIAAAASKIKEY